MAKHIIALSILLVLFSTTISLSQGSYALPFLLISPTAEANGMGEASVANHTDDPLSVVYNPAHLGIMTRTTHLSSGYNSSPWLANTFNTGMSLKTYGIDACINLGSPLEGFPKVGIGAAYSRINLNYGNMLYKIDASTGERRYFSSDESSDQYSFGIGIHSLVRLSAGVTLKHVESRLYDPMQTETTLYDYGFLVDLPIADIMAELAGPIPSPAPHCTPHLDWSLAISKQNMGKEWISYPYGAIEMPNDALPRLARAGMGFDIGLTYAFGERQWKAFSLKWTIEADDPLVTYDPRSGFGYQPALGDIKFFDEIILGHTNSKTTKAKGWEFGIFDFLSIRGGRFEEDYNQGNRRFSTFGFSLRSGGIRNILDVLDVPTGDGEIVDILLDHLDLRYTYSNLIGDENAGGYPSALNGIKFHSFNAQLAL